MCLQKLVTYIGVSVSTEVRPVYVIFMTTLADTRLTLSLDIDRIYTHIMLRDFKCKRSNVKFLRWSS